VKGVGQKSIDHIRFFLEPSHTHFPFASSSFRLPFVDASGVGGFGGWLGGWWLDGL